MKIWILVVLLVVGVGFLSGCGKAEGFGKELTEREINKVGDILSNPDKYADKTVKVEGKIVTECSTGCWIDLKGEKGIIYVDMKPSSFAIPQKVGHKATVEGKVKTRDGKTMIIGEGVQIK